MGVTSLKEAIMLSPSPQKDTWLALSTTSVPGLDSASELITTFVSVFSIFRNPSLSTHPPICPGQSKVSLPEGQ